MKKKILIRTFFLMLISFLIAFFIGVITISKQYDKSYEQRLSAIASTALLDQVSIEKNPQTFVKNLSNSLKGSGQDIRVSIISPSGNLLADSYNGEVTSNHLNRPEVKAALESGSGSDKRKSSTTSVNYIYQARRMDNGNLFRLALDMKEVKAASLRYFLELIAIFATIIIASVIIMRIMLNKNMKALEELSLAASKISSGDYKARVFIGDSVYKRLEAGKGQEIDSLALSFNKMAASLEEYILQLEENAKKLTALEQVRVDFMGNVTHELKTPLTSLQEGVELLKSGKRDEKSKRFIYEILEADTKRLKFLIDDMLTLSHVETMKEDPDARPVKLNDILSEAQKQVHHLANSRGVTIYDNCKEEFMLYADPMRLEQLFVNLFTNAIKYGKENGRVLIEAHPLTLLGVRGIDIKVIDDGRGIEEKYLDRLFERFYRVDKDRSREVGGTGLGLAIVKHIANLYGGYVKVESEVGKGTSFIVHLPLYE